MAFCSHCGEELGEGAVQCGSCGKPLRSNRKILKFAVSVAVVFAAGGLVAKNTGGEHGWGDEAKVRNVQEQMCRNGYAQAVVFATTRGRFMENVAGDDVLKRCIEATTPAVRLCREHEFGTDTAAECLERRVGAVLKDFYRVY